MKILIVDQHAPSIAVLSHALASRGYAFETASSVGEAIARIVSFSPDVVVYEWNLREGGHGVAKRFRAASLSALTVIALSALNEPDGFREAEHVDAYLKKPFDAAQLESALAR